jgi:uncharacterized protein (TIGR03437 family)
MDLGASAVFLEPSGRPAVIMHLIHRATFLLTVCFPLICAAQTPASYTISTVAGNGTAGYTGDAGAATSAELNGGYGVALDAAGNLYIADENNNVVRKVTPAGVISTFAGNGTAGYSGDGGAATSAELYTPQGVAFDASGNLYIADTGNCVIRKVNTAGTISTAVGNGTPGYEGDGGLGTAAELYTPSVVYFDSAGDMYIADTGNDVIRMVSAVDGDIGTVAGALVPAGYGDGGTAITAQLINPEGIVLDTAGNLYIGDGGDNRVRIVNTAGIIETFAGIPFPGYSGDGGQALQAQLSNPKGLAMDSAGNLYITDSRNNAIRRVAPNGIITTIAGTGAAGYSGDGGAATSAELNTPTAIALGPGGTIYIADEANSRIRLLTPNLPPPTVGTGGVISASGFGGSSSIAPGDWIEIYGTNLASATRGWLASDFSGVNAPTQLDGTSVTIGGLPAYVAFISSGQVNVQAPSGLASGTQPVIVTTPGGSSTAVTVNVNAAQPGMLATPLFDVGGTQYVAAIMTDFTTFVAPAGAISGLTTQPAAPGDTIVIYGVGFGPVTPAIPAGQTVTQLNSLTLPLQVFFGSTSAQVTYYGLAPNAVGLYQFNVVVPQIASSNAVPLTFTLNGVAGTQTLYTAVQN